MNPFAPDLSLSDAARRKEALSRISLLIQEGFEADKAHRIRYQVPRDMPYDQKAEQDLSEMLLSLSVFSTETLEYTAALRSSPDAPRPYLHRIFRSLSGWEIMTGEHSDMMFRDVISLRHVTVSLSFKEAANLFETYKATGIEVGRLHEVGAGHDRMVAEALILVARVSRMADSKRVRQETAYQRGEDYDEWEKRQDKALHESQNRDHLTKEWISYLNQYPQKRSAVSDLLIAKAQPLSAITPEYFEEHEAAHATMKSGVL